MEGTPLSLLISCKLSFSIVGLKMSSLPTLALKSPNVLPNYEELVKLIMEGTRFRVVTSWNRVDLSYILHKIQAYIT
jgi:hypothetical protein